MNTADGYYVYVETSSPRTNSDKARLISPLIPGTPRQCLRFWYHMYGQTTDSLNVFFERNNGNTLLIWRMYGDKNDQWYLGSVAITEESSFLVITNFIFPPMI